jgi:anti-sigma factor RsiW
LAVNQVLMARLEIITESDLLDYVEGRLSADDRATVAKRLSEDSALARRCDRVREQTLNVRMLRAVLAVEAVPQEWLDLLAKGKPH